MDLAYVLDWPKSPKTGVPSKVFDQIKVWNKHIDKVTLLVIVPKKFKSEWLGFADRVFSYENSLGRILCRFICSVYLICFIRPQVIYRRYGIYTISELITIILKPTILEINSDNHTYYKMKSNTANIIFKAQKWIVNLNVVGACAVTPEIVQMQQNRLKNITGVFTNSINLERFQKRDHIRVKSNLSLAFVASSDFEWNGLKRLESIARQFPEINFHIVGIDFKGPTNIYSHKPMFDQDLSSFLRKMDFGISTLDLQKVGLTEAAPLKSRLYLSEGLPVIGSYLDPAIQMDSKLYFQIKFEESSNQILNLGELLNFMDYWSNKAIDKLDLRQISSDSVEKDRVEFIRNRLNDDNNCGHT